MKNLENENSNEIIEMRFVHSVFFAIRKKDTVMLPITSRYNSFHFDLLEAINELKK
jgi:hypothetical protein